MVVRLKVKAERLQAERISFILSVRQFESNYVSESLGERLTEGETVKTAFYYMFLGRILDMIFQGSKQKPRVWEGEVQNEKRMGSQNENTVCVHFCIFLHFGASDVLALEQAGARLINTG